jgi:hypothetical protein
MKTGNLFSEVVPILVPENSAKIFGLRFRILVIN